MVLRSRRMRVCWDGRLREASNSWIRLSISREARSSSASSEAVSYTHLDVYKRQSLIWSSLEESRACCCSPSGLEKVMVLRAWAASRLPRLKWESAWRAGLGERSAGEDVYKRQNPTGAVAPVETRQEIARICIKHDLIVLTDEIYRELRYDGKPHVSIASLPGMKERTPVSYTHLDVYKRQE